MTFVLFSVSCILCRLIAATEKLENEQDKHRKEERPMISAVYEVSMFPLHTHTLIKYRGHSSCLVRLLLVWVEPFRFNFADSMAFHQSDKDTTFVPSS